MIQVRLENITWESADSTLPKQLAYDIPGKLENGLDSIMLSAVMLAYENEKAVIDDADVEYQELLEDDEDVVYQADDELDDLPLFANNENEDVEELLAGLDID